MDKAAIDGDTAGTVPFERGSISGRTQATAGAGIEVSAAVTIIARQM